MATRVFSCSNTRARTVNSPSLRVTGWHPPTPPLTGSNGSGVTLRTAMPARKAAAQFKTESVRQSRKESSLKFIANNGQELAGIVKWVYENLANHFFPGVLCAGFAGAPGGNQLHGATFWRGPDAPGADHGTANQRPTAHVQDNLESRESR